MANAVHAIEVEGLSKSFGGQSVVDDLTLTIEEGEFFTLLGPSGCGKSTTLRLLAGFEAPDVGTIRLHGQDVTGIAPNRRDLNLVFQQYALFPHMSVLRNVEYGLRMRGVATAPRRARAVEMIETVGLTGMEARRPHQLSGGQQQRVALARALVNAPAALLLDEPLGALDVKLRRRLQEELKEIQRSVGTTFVYVTHDQEEAFSMSDRIAVMASGRLEQIGTPREIYERPVTEFCAGFVGSLNTFSATLRRQDSGNGAGWLGVGPDYALRLARPSGVDGDPVTVAVRPERVMLAREEGSSAEYAELRGVVEAVVFMGMVTTVRVRTAAGSLTSTHMSAGSARDLSVGQPVWVHWPPDDAWIVAEPSNDDPTPLEGEVDPPGVVSP